MPQQYPYDPNNYSFMDPAVRSSGRGTVPHRLPNLSTPFDPTTDPYLADPDVQDLMRQNELKQRQGPTPPPAPKLPIGAPYTPNVPNYLPIEEVSRDPEPEPELEEFEPAMAGLQAAIPPQGGDITKSPMQANWPLDLRRLQEDREGELKRQVNLGGDALGPSRFAGELKDLQEDMAGSPFTGDAPHAQQKAFEALQQQAVLQGFASPQEQKDYERTESERRSNIPLETERIQQSGALAQERARQEGGLATEQERQRGALGVAKEYTDVQRMLQGQMGNLAPGGRFSMSRGGFSVTNPAAPKIPPTIINRLTTAQQNFERYGNARGSAAELAAAKVAAVTAHPADLDTKQLADQIMNDPVESKLSFNQLVEMYGNEDGSPMSPDDQENLREILGYLRGRSF